MLPLVAMQAGDDVDWGPGDFLAAAVLLAAACGAIDLALRSTRGPCYLAGVALAAGTALALVWSNLAVGLIGSEDDPANLLFAAVLAIGLLGAVVARFDPPGMARALALTAGAQALVAVFALASGAGGASALAAAFVVPWLAAAALFRRAAAASGTPPAPAA
ncbi:hypothetical protein [Coralloluteibacterium stylophorae]|uniref:Uncharacterized protein n=1 Tax=Coralloluteibacterium stylophorae TaxID=1776034 RepID=A0A8J7VS84_9GAMM|nr:hypothetical protein [Coralloluteibacterium stylophorae]MBS7458271.1 hypothetical protein [Coralloluteibacterium stylophorae]